jgi:aryl-alcohol dehydrogenase-like predicted oxidoreductase|tara:strand:- start:8843 stop:9817 length:975 start_codon:yes stop_codon:yes gene_type:complete
MKYRQFGNTGIEVSAVGFGAWGIGGTPMDAKAYGPTDDKISQQALKKAFDMGVTFYDTSPLYGYGHSEELIGATFKSVRERIVISSKVGFVNFKGKQDFSPEYIQKSLESSLRRLQTDYIDVFQLHDPPIELLRQDSRIVECLKSLKSAGKIRVIGISTKSPEESLIAIDEFNFESAQVNFNLVDQRALDIGLFRKCEENGVGVIGRTPLCFGFLTGQYNAKDSYDPSDHRSLWSPEQIDLWANAYRLFADELIEEEEQTNAQISLRFCLSYPALSTIIPGMLTVEHVEENTESSKMGSFSSLILEKFNQIYKTNDFFVKQGVS